MSYRILSPTAILGYGFPVKSLKNAMKSKIDLIACDAGSMDAGPYYLGKGIPYVEKLAVKRDFSLILKAAIDQQCPLILGTCGFCGDTPHLQFMADIVKEVCFEQGIENIKVALIDSHVANDLMIETLNDLKAIGQMPKPTKENIENSTVVAQMGIAPFITALDAGAQIILAGRSCDVAVFAADPIRRGYDPGIAYHVGHILECGAIACDPASGSDCLMAEFLENKTSAIFIALNEQRKITIKSIAAHSLYEESHPSLQHYPEGVLSLENTEYFQYTSDIAGIRNSIFVQRPLSIKVEASEKIGKRLVAFLPALAHVPLGDKYRVYGKDAVEVFEVDQETQEMGLLIVVTGSDKTKVNALASILKAAFLHYGYEGRRTTAGNMAYPLSPSSFSFITTNSDNPYGSIILGGTRSTIFIQKYSEIVADIRQRMQQDYPDLSEHCKIEIKQYTEKNPLIFIDSIGQDYDEALHQHESVLKQIQPYIDQKNVGYDHINAGDVYIWSLFHVVKDLKFIKQLFPIQLYNIHNGYCQLLEKQMPKQVQIGVSNYHGNLQEQVVDVIQIVMHDNLPKTEKKLLDMTSIIRSKDAGVNTLTYDIFFNSEKEYNEALNSNVFTRENIAKVLSIPLKDIIGTYQINACNAIKISRFRRVISGSPGTRDVFGAQQQTPIEKLKIPVYS